MTRSDMTAKQLKELGLTGPQFEVLETAFRRSPDNRTRRNEVLNRSLNVVTHQALVQGAWIEMRLWHTEDERQTQQIEATTCINGARHIMEMVVGMNWRMARKLLNDANDVLNQRERRAYFLTDKAIALFE